MGQFFIISLLQCTIQISFQLFCMALQCLALDINYSYWVIFNFFSDILSFGLYFKSKRDFFSSENLFTLVSNMQISRFNLIIYNSRNWAASYNLISPDARIFFRDLTCSTFLENKFLNIHPKLHQLQNWHNWFLTWNIWRKCGWCDTWKMTGMHTYSNWWNATRVIT